MVIVVGQNLIRMVLLRRRRITRLFEGFYRRLGLGPVGYLGLASDLGARKLGSILLDIFFVT
jgi:hypothetical protein